MPGSLRSLMLGLALAISLMQAGIVNVPTLLLLEPGFLLVQVSQRSLGRGGSMFQFGAGLGFGGQIVGEAIFQPIYRLLGRAGAAVGGHGNLRVLGGTGQPLQQIAALVVVGLEKGGELALGQQDGASELVEGKPQALRQ